jgi:hypothetical protein
MTDRPTDAAIAKFKEARLQAIQMGFAASGSSTGGVQWAHLSNSLLNTAEGLSELATGIRAVYILLEKIQNSARR